ncbi:hypothetical protein EMCRGX_G005551 [Ephydatia muelleri]
MDCLTAEVDHHEGTALGYFGSELCANEFLSFCNGYWFATIAVNYVIKQDPKNIINGQHLFCCVIESRIIYTSDGAEKVTVASNLCMVVPSLEEPCPCMVYHTTPHLFFIIGYNWSVQYLSQALTLEQRSQILKAFFWLFSLVSLSFGLQQSSHTGMQIQCVAHLFSPALRLVVADDDTVTEADDGVTGADDGVTGADDTVTGADDGVTGADDGVTGADDTVTGADDGVTGADDTVTGADDGVTGADDSVTGADDSMTGADDGVTGADDSMTGADDGVTGTDDSMTGADDGMNGADDGVTGADDGVTGADDGVTGADGLAVDVHVVGVLHCFLADLLQKGVAGNDFHLSSNLKVNDVCKVKWTDRKVYKAPIVALGEREKMDAKLAEMAEDEVLEGRSPSKDRDDKTPVGDGELDDNAEPGRRSDYADPPTALPSLPCGLLQAMSCLSPSLIPRRPASPARIMDAA